MRRIFSSPRKRKEGGTLKAVDEQYGSNLIVDDGIVEKMMGVDSAKDLLKFLKGFDVKNVETFSFLCGKHRRKYPKLWTNKVFNAYAERIAKFSSSASPISSNLKAQKIVWKDAKNAKGERFGRLFNKHLIVNHGPFDARFQNAKLSKNAIVYSQIADHDQFEFFYPCRVVRCREEDYYDLLFGRSSSSYVRKNVYRPDIRVALGGSLCHIL